MAHYEVVDTDDVEETDLSEVEEIPPDLNVRAMDRALGTEEIGCHTHAEQEELYYVLDGEFSLKLGPSGEAEYVEVGPGAFWVAGPETGHGHRYVGDDRGAVLAVGAPYVEDPGLDPHSLD